MRRLFLLCRRLKYLLFRSRFDADLREEIETHRVLRQVQLERVGLDPAEAAHASRRMLGHVEAARDDVRDVWLGSVDAWRQDIRHGFKTLV